MAEETFENSSDARLHCTLLNIRLSFNANATISISVETTMNIKTPTWSSILLLATFTASFSTGDAFVVTSGARRCTSLNLEDHIADMIDGELHRLRHKPQYQQQLIEKQRQWSKMEPTLPPNFDFDDGMFDVSLSGDTTTTSVHGFTAGASRNDSQSSPRRKKDEKMARDDPMRYCADRCVTTGNCDVFEDMFGMSPTDVIKFCKECVLSEDEEPCDVPLNFLEGGGLRP